MFDHDGARDPGPTRPVTSLGEGGLTRLQRLRATLAAAPIPDATVDAAGHTRTDRLDRVRTDLDALAHDDLASMPAGCRDERVRALAAIVERAQAELVRTVGVWDASGDWAADGSLAPRPALARRTATSRAEASRLVRDARLCREHREVGEHLDDGRLSIGHVRVLARAGAGARRRLLARDLPVLLAAAGTLDVDEFELAVRRWIHLADDELDREPHPDRTNHVSLAPTTGGWHLAGWLDPATGELVAQAIEHACPPDPATREAGVRSAAERRADALHTLAASYLSDPTTGAVTARLVVHASLDALTRHGFDPATHLADLDRCGPIPLPTLDRLACDPHLERVVFAGRGQVLEVGRATRVVPVALRRALEARDRHCRWPGCDRPAAWADAHHVVPWAQGGPTNLDNLVLLCAAHHRKLHDEHWCLTLDPLTGTVAVVPRRRRDPRASRTHDPPPR